MATLLSGALGTVRRVVTSPATRATQTAARLVTPNAVVQDMRLAEMRFGAWEGRRVRDLATTGRYQSWARDPVLFRAPDGEAGAVVLARALAALIGYGTAGGLVAVVSHKHLIRLVTAYAAGLPLGRYREISAPVSSVTRIGVGPSGLSLVRAASVEHLPPAWRPDPDHIRSGSRPGLR
jgi:broad specificity phosphatase PhoE